MVDGFAQNVEDVTLGHQYNVRCGSARFNISRRHMDYLFKTDTAFTARAAGPKEQREGCMEGTIIVTIYGWGSAVNFWCRSLGVVYKTSC